jgi:hypothetical protein
LVVTTATIPAASAEVPAAQGESSEQPGALDGGSDDASATTLEPTGVDDPPCAPIDPFPEGVIISPPSVELPANVAAFSGAWQGTWENVRPSRLVIESIDVDQARIAYGIVGVGRQRGAGAPASGRREATIAPDGRLTWGALAQFSFTISEDHQSLHGSVELPGEPIVGRVTMTRCTL